MNYYSSSLRTQRSIQLQRSPIATSLAALLLCVAQLLGASSVFADDISARQAMEDSSNPLLNFNTSRGEIYIELLPREAPQNAANILALATGEKEIEDTESGFVFRPNYYDGQRFHRVIPGFVIQTGAAVNHPLGAPGETLPDEINADSLGLDRQLVMLPGGSVNPMLDINDREEFENQVLKLLLANMGIEEADELEAQQERVYQRLQNLTIKALYELEGYRYQTRFSTRPVSRGTVVLANRGPDSNSAEFFIALTDSPSLTGKYTVVGRVVEGMDVVDAIGTTGINPQRFSRLSTVIYTARQVSGSLANATAAQ